jgi:23S rRNA (cytidine1920-2'-O)/16S rRNA (cytidine1409-2'-O)-methyltransferase
MAVSRAGAKLQAALDQFGLTAALAGARAVDVGASAGGFTEVMLAQGAVSVLAVDVGRDQLHPSLRADPRVTVREETDWRKLPLHEAEGPFDFFTVDVSFVAARNMLARWPSGSVPAPRAWCS